MNPEESTEADTSEIQETTQVNPLHTVTPLSKYLAMVLFVFLPFLGGYIGYVYAPEKVVGVEKVVVTDMELAEIDDGNLLQMFQSQFDTSNEIEFLYKSMQSGVSYYKTLTFSSKSSRVVGYVPGSNSFSETDFFIDFAAGEKPSPDGRYLLNIEDYSRPTTSIYFVDLEAETKMKSILLQDTETLWSGKCGYSGPTFNFEWIDSMTLKYAVHQLASVEKEGCDTEFIEYREEKLTEVVVREKTIPTNNLELVSQILRADSSKTWSIKYASNTVYIGDDREVDLSGITLVASTTINYPEENFLNLTNPEAHDYTDLLKAVLSEDHEVIIDADGLPTRDLDVYSNNEHYISVLMNIAYRPETEEDNIEEQSMFGIPIGISYEIFITDDL
jgi:hypothetical protein